MRRSGSPTLLAVVLTVLTGIVIYTGHVLLDREAANSNKPIAVIEGFDQPQSPTNSSRRKAIEQMARRENRSVEDVEMQIVGEILRSRAEQRKLAGDHGPGIYIVAGDRNSYLDPNAVKNVPEGTILNIGDVMKSGHLRSSRDIGKDKSIYVDASDLAVVGLGNDKMIGYSVSGTYLGGGDYATTSALRNLEATPSGKTGWTGLTRFYANYGNIGDVVVDDLDILAGRQTVLVPGNTLNVKVANYPGTLARLKTAGGLTMSDVTWTDHQGISHSVKIRQIDDKSVSELMRLAEKLAG